MWFKKLIKWFNTATYRVLRNKTESGYIYFTVEKRIFVFFWSQMHEKTVNYHYGGSYTEYKECKYHNDTAAVEAIQSWHQQTVKPVTEKIVTRVLSI